MTLEEKKEWLGSYCSIVREIDALCEEHEKLSSRRFKLAKDADRLEAILQLIHEDMEGLAQKRKAIKAAIDTAPTERQREILFFRYMMGLTVEQVSKKIHLDERYVYRISKEAINAIEIPQEV